MLPYRSRNSAVVNTAAAAIRQCTGAVFDQACKDVPPSSSDSVSSNDKTSAFKFTPASKSAFFLFQDLCLLTSGSVPHWFQGIESISPLLGLELIESVLLNYCDLFIREKEFLHLLKERVCPLVTKLLAPDAQTGGSRDPGDGPGVAASSAPSVFGIHVRLNRIVVLLCSKYFACLNAECGVLLSTVMRTVDTETAMWRLALALEVMFKVISLPDLLVNICATFDLANPQSRVFRGLVTTASGFVQSTLLASHVPNRDSVGAPSGMSAGHQPSQKPALIYRGGNFVIADVQKFAILELLDRLEPPCLPEGYSLRLAISCLLQFVWSLQHVIQRVKSSDKPQTEHKMLKLSWTGLLPALSLLLEACADEKLTDSFLLAESVMVVLSSLCGLGDSREAFVASICKSALPSLSVLSERQYLTLFAMWGIIGCWIIPLTCYPTPPPVSPKHRQPPQVCDEATDRSPVVIVVNANHGPGNLSLEVSSSSSSGGSSVDVPPGTNGSQAPSSLFITAKHIQISKSLLELAKTNGSLLESSWFPVLTTMQQLVWMLGLRAAPSATGSSMSNAQNAPTPMSLDTSFFENASAPNIATQGGGVVSKVISELPTLSQTLSFVFEQSKNFDEIALGYLIRALCSVASETLEISTTNRVSLLALPPFPLHCINYH
ncbi:unnamed protein product [Mesocestoides corti]|uniref:Mon2/Sec7/BIG1-like HUS domain-containing protein n=1 Tax=Mesocestoides corti TaxID=53468 RepID=A0A158QWA3_MESCO|nr:unnamed protein product [Mesocestoides corti]